MPTLTRIIYWIIGHTQETTYVRSIQYTPPEKLARRNEDALAQARAWLGDRHILVRPLVPGDYWRSRAERELRRRDFDARR